MAWLTVAGLLARYSDRRVATAANCDEDVIAALRSGDSSDLTAEQLLQLAAVRPRIETALADATSAVQAAVAVRYDLPLPSVPALLARLVADRALLELYGDVIPEDLEDRRRQAGELLAAIEAGSRRLTADDGTPLARRPLARAVAPEPALARAALGDA